MGELLRKYGESAKWSKFQVITRYPLADEINIRKHLADHDCNIQSLLWEYRDELFLMNISAQAWRVNMDNPPSLWFILHSQGKYHGTFYIVSARGALFTHDIDHYLGRVAAWVDENRQNFEEKYGFDKAECVLQYWR